MKIYLNFLNIYNYENFRSKKITIKNADIKFRASNFNFFLKQIFSQKKRLNIDNLNLMLIDKILL